MSRVQIPPAAPNFFSSRDEAKKAGPLRIEADVLILGGGLAGLAAACVLGERALVLEKELQPGGLVRCLNFDGYWFDRVLHILYFSDSRTEERIRRMLGPVLAPNPPAAWVETLAGTTRYPIQVHLNGLDRESLIRCVHDLAREHFTTKADAPDNFQEVLLRAFGQRICDIFMYPYNQKVWKRSLSDLAPSGFQWTIVRPDFDEVLRGALSPYDEFLAYNARGWYPLVPRDQPIRGMEYLSAALARNTHDIRLAHRVTAIDTNSQIVVVEYDGDVLEFRYRRLCSTLPLPLMLDLCRQTPGSLRSARGQLDSNRVISVAFSVQGPRPPHCGHWRYYADPALIFNRLVFMHEFDPDHAPTGGWGLMAEITEPASARSTPLAEMVRRTRADVLKTGILGPDCRIVDANVFTADPAYVVFTTATQRTAAEARSFFRQNCVDLLGRYGRWEYSSMSQVMRDGFEWAENIDSARGAC
jgi:protoporphyrinogen oxidase